MLKINDDCIDSADWMEEIGFTRPCDDVVTLEYFDNARHQEFTENYFGTESYNYWDYPLSEISHLIEMANEMDCDYELQLVRFADGFGGYEYRLCEV